jgi:L-ascorbate metabolism protein UlaG (beta-lactamase superfamily)
VKITWLGHASFIIETDGRKIVTDPFGEPAGYPVWGPEGDIVTVSHDHWDHNAVEVVKGNPRVIKGNGLFEVDGIQFKGVAAFHDKANGQERGAVTIYRIFSEDISLVHLGDLGHVLTQEQVKEIGQVNILLAPVGGKFTIDAAEAVIIVEQLKPDIVIPMHYNTPHLSFELAPVEDFTARFDQVVKKPYLELNANDLKKATKVIVLDYLS